MLIVGGRYFDIEKSVIEQFPDSVFEAIFSGRQHMDEEDGIPKIDRDPLAFQKMIETLNNHDDLYH